MDQLGVEFWSFSADEMLQKLNAKKQGLTNIEAGRRLSQYGTNLLKPKKRKDVLTQLISQFKSPIILILFFATGLSFFLHDRVDAFIILLIVLVSGLLGFWQEHSASNAVEKLLSIVQIKATVLRDGIASEIPIEQIVPGDIVTLRAGDIIPGDGLVQESKDLFVDEAMLTGETFPVEKTVTILPAGNSSRTEGQCFVDGDACGERHCNFTGRSHRKRDRIRKGFGKT